MVTNTTSNFTVHEFVIHLYDNVDVRKLPFFINTHILKRKVQLELLEDGKFVSKISIGDKTWMLSAKKMTSLIGQIENKLMKVLDGKVSN